MDPVESKAAVYVALALTKRGKRTIQFAGDLARRLNRDLVALVEPNANRDKLAEKSGLSVSHENDLVLETIVGLTNVDSSRCRIEGNVGVLPKGAIRVTSDSKNWDPNPSEATFFAASEVGIFARSQGPIYVTVGDKWTHPTAINEAVLLAKSLQVGVILYHSTWKIPGNTSNNPRDHVSPNALKVLSAAVEIARNAGVPVEIALDHAPTIVDGVLHHAIENGASAIVMTKSSRARRGSYVDQVVVHSPVPVFVAPRSIGGTNVDDLPPAMDNLPFFAKQPKVELPKHVAFAVMAGVILMYLVEVFSKLKVGGFVGSTAIVGDGWHNVADLFQACIVVVSMHLSNQPASQHYPYGWQNLEHLFAVLVGISLSWTGGCLLWTSVSAITISLAPVTSVYLSRFVSQHETLHMSTENFFWAIGVMTFAIVVSVIFGYLEVWYGRKYGYPSMVADGLETISDAKIATAAVIGILCEYRFGLPQIEYYLSAVISFFILHASWKIGISGGKGLLGHSMGDEKEQAVRELVTKTRGVLEIVKLKSSINGSSVTVDLHLLSKVLRSSHLRTALENRVTEYCKDNGFNGVECHVEFEEIKQPGEDQKERIAFAAIAHPTDPTLAIVAPSLAVATHIVGADDEKYSHRRSFIDPIPKDFGAYFRDKHMKKLYVYGSVSPADAKAAEDAGVPITPVSTYCLETLGA